MSTVRVLGLSGSLRKGSYNTALLHAAQELAPEGMTIETFDIRPIPFYDEDLRAQGFPPPVAEFRERIAAADAVLFCTPEYNRSIPGVLKNAIDWASRPPSQPFDGKPVAVIGASPSVLGTALANYHLRQVLVFLNVQMVNGPEVLVGLAAQKIDSDGRLTDEKTRQHVRGQLEKLLALARSRP